LTGQSRQSNKNIGISLSYYLSKKLGLDETLADVFTQLGFKMQLFTDGNPQALKVDVLILAGLSSYFVKFPELLSKADNSSGSSSRLHRCK